LLGHGDEVGQRPIFGQETPDFDGADGLEDLVGVQDEDPVPVGRADARVARGRKIVVPRVLDDPGTIALDDQAGIVG
jgi:hypothetical protein